MNAPHAGQNSWRNVLSRVSGSSSSAKAVVCSILVFPGKGEGIMNVCTYYQFWRGWVKRETEKIRRWKKNERWKEL
jgi:hypothetical protein